MEIKGLAARAAVWSARHRAAAILGWLAFVIAITVVSGQIGTLKTTDTDRGHGDSGRADRIVAEAGFPVDPATEMVLIQKGTPADRATAAEDVARSLTGIGTPAPPIVSPDRQSTLVTFTLPGDDPKAALAATAAVQQRHPDLYIAESGPASADLLINEKLVDGLTTLGMLSIPLALGILLVAFGAVVAALLPVALAVTAIVAAAGLLAVASRAVPTVDATLHVMLLLGLAVGVDYCLFYIRRERDERRAGADPHRALVIAAQTSGRSVWISGLTVIMAMAGMFLTRDATFNSFATGTILVVATAVLGSLTVLPALLSALGDRVDAIKIPGLYRHDSKGRVWSAVVRVALARPLISAALATAALVVIALPVFDLRTKAEGIEDLSPELPVVAAGVAVRDAFPARVAPAEVVVKDDSGVRGPALDAAATQLAVAGDIEVNPAGTVAIIPSGLRLTDLRDGRLAALFPGATVLVTGEAAQDGDFNHQLEASVPWVFGFVLGLAFLLLLVSFRSVAIAVTGLVLNVLSVAAAYGMLVFVFQYGHFAGLLDFAPAGGITNWLPLFLFITLFGLSMDYHVFVLSRIREGHDRGLPTRRAVAEGITGTAGVITSAAAVMVVIFALFATLPIISMKQVGIGLAAAVLLDATIVRAVLLPAVMVLLGRANWWLPRWLRWLPETSHEVAPDEPAKPPEKALEPA
ncbi:MMPL family transporter [Actinoplanes sp. NBRC 103695]|uniref:MMPL family transporter n=1 Tax=Actinoplanes sp. NBRC 103695 TaxID=3032202 RepID=UPI0024A3F7E7|nr:MMPL family transporter [Actinoplanes sp. NBRC 103695]GLY98074.1 membrane protein [Actinoplanes sp. NBRC 103695]